METVSRKYSVFLTPAADDYAYTDMLIREFSGKYDVPPFEPHLTIYSGTFTEPDELEYALEAAVKGVGPISLPVRGIGCTEEYFKTLFIEFEENETLRGIHERIRAGLPFDSGYRLFPHLSLLYNEMPLSDKQALARRVRLDRDIIHFSEAKIATAANAREGWRDISQWRTVCRVKLGKENPEEAQ